jgi:hypothetical protein
LTISNTASVRIISKNLELSTRGAKSWIRKCLRQV